MKIAIIGAGISGMTVAHQLKSNHNITIYEKERRPGGLVKCDIVEGNLFHTCGGHVFNSKYSEVLDWFWSFFKQTEEFIKADRNSVVFMRNGLEIPYPIENHAYLFDEDMKKEFIHDLIFLARNEGKSSPTNFEEFLRGRFGETLYNNYFQPYNKKIWKRDLSNVPLTWLEGKLPMPTVEEMIYNNINHVKEKQFVHSSFWYEKYDGSQFLADRLASGLNIRYGKCVDELCYMGNYWMVDGQEYDNVVFCGNLKEMVKAIRGVDISGFHLLVEALEYHGTTSVFCEIAQNPYSWIYLPSDEYQAHRIICTGNFSPTNNSNGMMTGTVEFTDYVDTETIKENLDKMPLNPRYITHQYNKYTYPIQDASTKEMIQKLKRVLSDMGFYFTGRFADWEYYNMDVAMKAAMDTCEMMKGKNQ